AVGSPVGVEKRRKMEKVKMKEEDEKRWANKAIFLYCFIHHHHHHHLNAECFITALNQTIQSPLLSLAASHSHRFHRSSTPSSSSKFLHLGIMDMDLPKEQSRKKVVKKSSVSNIRQRAHKKDQKKHRSVLQERKLPDGLELSYILDEKDCFNPIIDSVTGEDFIPSMAYGSKVITAGMFRVFGREFAELPIVATSRPNQGKLKVKKLVIPAADNAKGMWTKKFGFKKVPPGTKT
ncbi:hypothetical protein M8C21_022428, partial [Ambrosia artemisiifolia]